jgi:hypothetical protein
MHVHTHLHIVLMALLNSDDVLGAQLGFSNIVGIPLFKAMADLFEDSQPMLDGVLANFRQWEEVASAQSDAPAQG